MDRFVTSTVSDFEQLLARTRRSPLEIADAAYPQPCDPPRGRLRFRSLDVGGFAVEVERQPLSGQDFRLSVLFSNGSCVFVDARDLAHFWRTAVAAAFGLPTPKQAVQEQLWPDPQPPRPQNPLVPLPPGRKELALRLAQDVRGQDRALDLVAAAVADHLAKRAPTRPETILLLGQTGTGKTATVQALADALADFCLDVPDVFRVDCNELTHSYDAKRFLGAAPGLVGYEETPPLAAALNQKGCIVLFDEVEKAHPEVRQSLLGLLDEGRLATPDGKVVQGPHAIIAMTTNAGADELEERAHMALDADEAALACECRELLREIGWAPEFVGRIGTFAVFRPLSDQAMDEVALRAVRRFAHEYDLTVDELPPVLLGAIRDIATRSRPDARGLNYATRQLLGNSFSEAARGGLSGHVKIEAGPPPAVRPV